VLDPLVEDFYGAIARDPDARTVLSDAEQLARLERSLREWAWSMISGPHDLRWFELRARIGHRHVEVGLPQRFVPLALARIRPLLTEAALDSAGGDLKLASRRLAALHKVLDLELTIMLESYLRLHNARVRQAERLGTLGQLAATVSHELKNPLGVINTSVHLIRERMASPRAAVATDAAPDADVRLHLERIARGSRHAARLAS
jgi:signal transduction histidine kinase